MARFVLSQLFWLRVCPQLLRRSWVEGDIVASATNFGFCVCPKLLRRSWVEDDLVATATSFGSGEHLFNAWQSQPIIVVCRAAVHLFASESASIRSICLFRVRYSGEIAPGIHARCRAEAWLITVRPV
jgi:hypothetical protein